MECPCRAGLLQQSSGHDRGAALLLGEGWGLPLQATLEHLGPVGVLPAEGLVGPGTGLLFPEAWEPPRKAGPLPSAALERLGWPEDPGHL